MVMVGSVPEDLFAVTLSTPELSRRQRRGLTRRPAAFNLMVRPWWGSLVVRKQMGP
jgi:hypothetical protein